MTYDLIRLERNGRVAIATIDAPPLNIITLALYRELTALAKEIEADEGLTVFILRSANPEFFMAHFDVAAILDFPTDEEPRRDPRPNPFHEMCGRLRTMAKVTIAQIEGRAGGGGSEIAMNCDLRYGVRGRTIINQMEVPIGILPGGTGTQRLPRLVGRGRALEIIMSGDDLDAETAERWGYLDRIFAADEIGPYVDRLAARIASFPPEAVVGAKLAINAADGPIADGLIEEAYQFQRLLRNDSAKRAMTRFLEIGGQTREGELRVGELNGEVNR
ncbi:enoyl-CoA hydratase/isomerase family protein [Chelatococcus reniformis]|uniref:Enoyl-CoA hydratase n=1 Tax=Chelatococcus reniformis TaxID=1494448 RepID=A0A916XM57_9HYPH|nr:enoyl-CoA hydratase/isomerase family protein [Chelatococcus reniformis]GGC85702.1 enoyl-CoA hydratase [Chelatococcus reniformis]